MKPTIEILERMNQNSNRNKNEIFTRVYRYLQRPDIYFLAYKNLYANSGAATPGVDNDTADGFSEEKIELIIQSLTDGTYTPKPVRRTYIAKKQSNKLRPLGLPTFTDKLVQEVIRMILEAIYEPTFCDTSHGFRPNRSCHTALGMVSKGFNGVKWFVEGDIKGCFDNINHNVLAELIGKKIKDARFNQLIRKFLKAGYMEDWRYHSTYSGTPQGGIISPVLANIYLHELDMFVEQLKAKFDKPLPRGKRTPEYSRLRSKAVRLRKKLENADEHQKPALLAELRQTRAKQLSTPSKLQEDKKIKYVRYADDFLIGVIGSKSDCEWVKSELKTFIRNTLKMELSEEKTLITHSHNKARFLGYDVCVRRNSQIKQGGNGYTKRTLNNKVELTVPFKDKIERFLLDKGIVKQINGKYRFVHRPSLLQITEYEIVSTYNAELRGICNYYRMASNFNNLNYFAYLMEYSCLKTLAAKRKSSIAQIIRSHQDGQGKWCVPYKTAKGEKRLYFAKYSDCKGQSSFSDKIRNDAVIYSHKRNPFEDGLKARVCKLCGTTEATHYEIHHVKRLKDLKGKAPWEKYLIARNRKTMVVCRDCHKEIHRN
ncbi:group II intron reverse transcriptase/maturase [Alkalicella caledoniensis]|uniref:Group II intron reverse transcriptase/maturase n=1 Tax=Alkalicella caledoniensis TaxID=2731377 RepID=A0A7G9W636_ALKCA|nr:reverse transcriptase domain-containing protein [Alkalicella caledoniensis]QNO13322.1 group II intron reverse transcriptase/maturase [Alkalicella caledoniensis]QNO14148.1 group II intron reverse transcriptase/maturase [Alkalicella caledoniensis]